MFSILLSLGLGIVGSIIGNYIYDKLTEKNNSKKPRRK